MLGQRIDFEESFFACALFNRRLLRFFASNGNQQRITSRQSYRRNCKYAYNNRNYSRNLNNAQFVHYIVSSVVYYFINHRYRDFKSACRSDIFYLFCALRNYVFCCKVAQYIRIKTTRNRRYYHNKQS